MTQRSRPPSGAAAALRTLPPKRVCVISQRGALAELSYRVILIGDRAFRMSAELVSDAAVRIGHDAREHVEERRLHWAGVFFALAVIVHNSDHLRRGTDRLTPEVFWLGVSGIVVEVALVVLIFQRHWLAPLAATVFGLALALGYIEVHFLPDTGAVSDSFTSATHVSPLSWFAASLEVVAALTVAAVGAQFLRAQGGARALIAANRGRRGFRSSRLHPITLMLAITQAAAIAISLVQAYG